MSTVPATGLQLRSLVTSEGTVTLSLDEVAIPEPGPGEVVVRVEAAPINPSDLGLLLAGADVTAATSAGSAARPTVTAPIPPAMLATLGGRLGQALPVGNEGGGVVVAAGESAAAQALLGRTVGMFGGAMYAQYRCLPAAQCLAMPEGIQPQQAASCFVNPLTALGMVETMRREGHTALVHTAAASNLGQMLNRICLQDGVALVSIVRRPEQAELLRAAGASHVCDASADTFDDDLVAALIDTGATIAFDAIGGGRMASRILAAMERAISAGASEFNRYGSNVHKQVYIYGGLDRGPTELRRTFGMAWGVGGWLLTPFLAAIGAEAAGELRARVAREITTTFASHYTATVSLPGALRLEEIAVYSRQATGTKYLIAPWQAD